MEANKENQAVSSKKRHSRITPIRSRRRVPGLAPRKQLGARYQILQELAQRPQMVAGENDSSDSTSDSDEIDIPPSLSNTPFSSPVKKDTVATYTVNAATIPICPKCALKITLDASTQTDNTTKNQVKVEPDEVMDES